jgi:spore germination protein GerM
MSRAFLIIALLVVVAAASWYWASHRGAGESRITVYYTKLDGASEIPWTVSMRPQQRGESSAEHQRNTVLYAATQAIAGPPSDVSAIRFPAGTHVLGASVNDSTALVDLSGEVKNQNAGVLGESGEFKSLVWTLTALPGIQQVAIRVQGQTLDTLPGGHLDLSSPLRRSDW